MEGTYQEAQSQSNADYTGLNGVNLENLIIPELEEYEPSVRPWSEIETAILHKYYRPGMVRKLQEYFAKNFPPGRSQAAIENKAQREGLQGRR